MNEQIRIARASIEDASQIAQIIVTVWGYQQSVDLIRQAIESDHLTHVAKTPTDEIVGFVDSFVTQNSQMQSRWELDLLAVHPEYRNQGIAGRLVAANLEKAQLENMKYVRALVRTDNVPVHNVLQRLGFTLEDETNHLCVCDKPAPEPIETKYSSHLIPVQTFTYQGYWIEDEYTRDSLRIARQFADPEKNMIVGAVIPEAQYRPIQSVLDGYDKLGEYFWCIKALE